MPYDTWMPLVVVRRHPYTLSSVYITLTYLPRRITINMC
jgi:hypothetical protein